MLQSQLAYPNPGSIASTFPPTQSVLVPSNSIQQGQIRTYDSVQNNSNQNARPFVNSQTNGPVVVNQAFSNQYQSFNSLNGNTNIVGTSVNQSSLRQTRDSKYKNKYSFKKNVTTNSVGPLTSTFNNFESTANLRISQEILNESNYYKTIVSKQQSSLAQIRDISLNLWRKFDQNRVQTTDSVRQINQIIKIYNLTLVNLNPPVKHLEFISEEVVNNRSNVVQNNQIIYKEVVPAPLPAFSQQHIIPVQPINHQIININQTPIIPPNTFFVPAQKIPQTIPQSIKIEQRPVNPSFEPRPAVIPQPQNCLPPSKPYQQTKYETFETVFNESKNPEHTQSFNYQKYKPYVNKDINIEPKYNHQPEYKPYVREATNVQNYYGGNTLNLNYGKDDGAFVYQSAQVRQLKRKIQQLEQQKTVLIDKIRVYEKSNNFENLNNQQTIQNCQQEISKLKAQITQLTVIYNNNTATKPNQMEVIQLKKAINILEETIKQYQEQLIQAQNHIIYLQNARGSEDVKNFEAEIKYLRQTIAKYTEHIEQIDIQKRQFEQLLQQKQTENHALAQEVHEANQYIQSLQQHIQNNPGQGNGISYELYQNLIIEYGKKELQVIILLQEINRLNFSNKEFQGHLEKAEEYIITLQESPNRDDGRLQALQVEHHNILNTIGQYEQKLLALSQENTSLRNRFTQVSRQKIEKVGSAVNQDQAQLIHLKEQIHKLNEKYNETKDHLQKAEEYIIHLQETYASKSPVTALQRPDSERNKMYEQQTKEWQARISQLENVLSRQIQEKESLSKRSVEFKAEYDDMEYRYKTALQQLGKRYDELLDERNSIAVKLSESQSKTNTGNAVSHTEVQNLRQSLKTITAQLQEYQSHLLTAESYIEQNSKNWEQASSFKEKHNQLQSFVTIINNDLESTRKQNQILATRIQNFETLVAQADKLKGENEQLTIVIREKDNVSVSTSLKQIDEVQEALVNYTRLYNESQQRIKQLELQQQKNFSQITQLEEYLAKAESFIIQQQNAEKIKENNVNELKQQLIKAEEHIFTLENEYNSALKLKDEYEAILRAEYQKNTELHDALTKAQAHIFELQSKYLKK